MLTSRFQNWCEVDFEGHKKYRTPWRVIVYT